MLNRDQTVIEVSDLCKRYDDRLVVDHINLNVKRGEVYGFLGPNGSGKTTSIRMMCGLVKPDGGSGQCLGYDIIEQPHLIKRKVGYMTQHFSLYKDLSIVENLEFIARLYQLDQRKERVARMIDQMAIGQKRKRQLAGQLSGGWKQRLALAAAVIHEPELLLLDEPTAGVDPAARRDFWDEIYRLSQNGVTSLVSTHYMDEAERCHRLAYIAYGKLLVSGSQQDVINHVNLETWEVQGENLSALASTLVHQAGLKLVSAFGQRLHVSIEKGSDLIAQMQAYQQDKNYSWQQVSPGLEDAFICLMQQQQDNFQ